MRLRITAAPATAFLCIAAAVSCFPDPPPDDGLADGGIFLSDGGPNTGDATVNGLALSTTTLDFGLSECGGTAPGNQKVTLTNNTSGDISYAAAPSGPSFQIVSPVSGKIAAGASFDLELSASAVSAFATAGGVIEGALQIVTDAPGQKLFVVDLKETAEGAQLVVLPSTANFGLIPSGDTGALDVGLRNNGNEPITVTFDDSAFGNFTLDTADGGGIAVGGNSTTTLHATWTFDGDSPTTQVLGFHTTGALCGGVAPPSSITLTGEVGYAGGPTITPGIVTFDVGGTGFIPCGQTAGSQKVTVANPSSSTYPTLNVISTTVTGPFTVSPSVDGSGPSLAVNAGASQDFTITPLAVNAPASTLPEGMSGTLDIVLDNEEELVVNLSQTAQGAVFSFSPSTQIDFGSAQLDNVAMQLLGITNSGNGAASLTLGITGSPYFSASPSAQFSVNTPGTQATIDFLPVTSGAQSATLTVTTSGPVCGLPSPATLDLVGNGVLPVDAGDDSGADTDSGDDGGIDSAIDEAGLSVEAG